MFSIEQMTTTLSARVAHHLEFELLPALDRLLEEDLRDGAAPQTAGHDVAEALGVAGDAAATPSEREGGAHDQREAELAAGQLGLFERMRESAARHAQADALHDLAELRAILGPADRLRVGADHLDAPQVEHTGLRELHAQVERRLAAQRRQERVRPLGLDDARERRQVERLDVGAGGEVRIGHDGRRVRVHEDDLEPVLEEHPAGLRTRVVELAGLSDHDRPRADDQDLLQVVAPRHQATPAAAKRSISSTKRAKR